MLGTVVRRLRCLHLGNWGMLGTVVGSLRCLQGKTDTTISMCAHVQLALHSVLGVCLVLWLLFVLVKQLLK